MRDSRPAPYKAEKLESMIHTLASKFILNEASNSSLLTVTRVELSPNKKVATIYFTTLPENAERTALIFLKRKVPEFKLFARDNSRIGMLPILRFEIDYGERNRQNIDRLLSEKN